MEHKRVTVGELQDFINDPSLDLPEGRRDISNPGNVRWLVRNLLFRNSEKVSDQYLDALKELYKKISRAA